MLYGEAIPGISPSVVIGSDSLLLYESQASQPQRRKMPTGQNGLTSRPMAISHNVHGIVPSI